MLSEIILQCIFKYAGDEFRFCVEFCSALTAKHASFVSVIFEKPVGAEEKDNTEACFQDGVDKKGIPQFRQAFASRLIAPMSRGWSRLLISDP